MAEAGAISPRLRCRLTDPFNVKMKLKSTPNLPKRWQDCEPFVAALKSRGYLTADNRVVMSDGVYLYMYEAWADALTSR